MTEPTSYLYGASVQGIQGFIFQTNDLKDIVGASELVEQICTDKFKEFTGNGTVVVNAAGNVKCIYEKRSECEKAVRFFPKKVLESAPGITISQAVVPLKSDLSDFESAVEKLEERLHEQRNKPLRSITYGTMGMMRSRKTGLPAVTVKNKKGNLEYLDEAAVAKRKYANADDPKNATLNLCKKSFGNKDLSYKSIAFDISDMTDKNDWIAIIHADGNGLGQIVAKMNKKPGELKNFSEKLDKATEKSAQQAFDDIVKGEDYNPTTDIIPFRPVVLGGDDMTVICRADLAMKYVTAYIKHFEENTKENGSDLTACAGIAYLKSSYPFHYGYRLAEALCDEAKKDAKLPEHLKNGKAPSCLMFHKIQGSYIESFSQIVENELTIDEIHSLEYGPYYLNNMENRWTIQYLRDNVSRLTSDDDEGKGNAAKTDIRQWLTLMHENIDYARQREKRVEKVASAFNKETFKRATTPAMRKDKQGKEINVYPAYDMLQLLTVENQVTKNKEDEEY